MINPHVSLRQIKRELEVPWSIAHRMLHPLIITPAILHLFKILVRMITGWESIFADESWMY